MATQPKKPKIHVENKIFKDPIHGLIEMEPLLVKIIDTPEFQRLRSIKQLGLCYLVYPGASHNRFEHSLGVCHLAGLFLEELQQRQPELKITSDDVLCVKIAGLCHDLGHGPFSHLFDTFVESKVEKDNRFRHHEERSRLILENLIMKNGLEQAFEERGLSEDHRKFIGELITASIDAEEARPAKRSTLGQRKEKTFLFQIVANKASGVDVDKWDYFARDSHMLGFKSDFDHIRCMKLARVIEAPGNGHQICFRDKEVFSLYQMFQTRFNLKRRACYHNVTEILDTMVKDVLYEADKHKKFGGKTITEIIRSEDCRAFCLLTDDILSSICDSTDQHLEKARVIVENIKNRKLYKLIGKKIWEDPAKDERQELEGTTEAVGGEQKAKDEHWLKQQIEGLDKEKKTEVLVLNMDYGKKKENPIDSVWFYKKTDINSAIHIDKTEVSYMLPAVMSERIILVCYKGYDKGKADDLREQFENWWDDNMK